MTRNEYNELKNTMDEMDEKINNIKVKILFTIFILLLIHTSIVLEKYCPGGEAEKSIILFIGFIFCYFTTLMIYYFIVDYLKCFLNSLRKARSEIKNKLINDYHSINPKFFVKDRLVLKANKFEESEILVITDIDYKYRVAKVNKYVSDSIKMEVIDFDTLSNKYELSNEETVK